jgi:AbiU2
MEANFISSSWDGLWPGKGAKPMSADYRIVKAKRLTVRVNDEIVRAIALQAMWRRFADQPHLITALRREPWFPLLRGSLHSDLLMTLCRLHEHGHEDNATIPVVRSLIEAPGVHDLLADPSAADHAKRRHDELRRTEAVRRIRVLRDRVLAHNDIRQTEGIAASDDVAMLLEETARIATYLTMAVGGLGVQFSLHQRTWESAAEHFWSLVVGGLNEGKTKALV